MLNKRLRKLREELGITQDIFSKRIGVTAAAISRYEKGDRKIPDSIVKNICHEYNVSEKWFRLGEGEIFNGRDSDAQIAYILGKALPNADNYVKHVFTSLGRLSEELTADDWKAIKKFVDALSQKDI